jgi:hypothetical protein
MCALRGWQSAQLLILGAPVVEPRRQTLRRLALQGGIPGNVEVRLLSARTVRAVLLTHCNSALSCSAVGLALTLRK